MSVIDLTSPEAVNRIHFWNTDEYDRAVSISHNSPGEVWIDDEDSSEQLKIDDKAHAEMLIKALQKAIEIGWLK